MAINLTNALIMTLMKFRIIPLLNIDMYGITSKILKFRAKLQSKFGPILPAYHPKIPHTNEILLDNYIFKDFQTVLKPLNIMQSLLLCSKYSIRDHFITCNSYIYNFIGVFGLMISRCIVLYQLFVSITDWIPLSLLLNWSNFYDFFIYSAGFILNYYINIKCSNDNILIVLKIQHVLRSLKITGKDLISLTIHNWISVITINCIIFGSIIYMFFKYYPDLSIMDMAYFYFSMTFDVNVVYAKFLIKLNSKVLRVWTEDVRKAGNSKPESFWESMFDVYLTILQIYRTVEKVFRHLIFFYTVFAVSHGLMNIAIILKMRMVLGSGYSLAIFVVVTQIWFLKNIIILTSLSIECEKFYAAVSEGQSTMITFAKRRGLSETQRRACKNVQRVQNAAFKKMDACGMFTVDASLPLNLFSFITNNTVVLLQFSM